MMRTSGLAAGGPFGFSDAAKRASDAVNTALLVDQEGNRGRWIALRLSDGGSDGTTYPNIETAIAFQFHYSQCAYLPIPSGGMSPREADVLLGAYNTTYANKQIPPIVKAALARMGA